MLGSFGPKVSVTDHSRLTWSPQGSGCQGKVRESLGGEKRKPPRLYSITILRNGKTHVLSPPSRSDLQGRFVRDKRWSSLLLLYVNKRLKLFGGWKFLIKQIRKILGFLKSYGIVIVLT